MSALLQEAVLSVAFLPLMIYPTDAPARIESAGVAAEEELVLPA